MDYVHTKPGFTLLDNDFASTVPALNSVLFELEQQSAVESREKRKVSD